MTMARTPEAVQHRPGAQARLLPTPFPSTLTLLNPHYKRCPKAQRLCLRSDQSPSHPQHGRSPDKLRHTLLKGYCQVRAPLTRRKGFAASGDAPEHGVIVFPWAIAPPWASAPFSDSPGVDLAGQSEQSDERRLKTNAPFKDSTVVTTGEHPTTNAGHGSPLPSLGVVEHFWWMRLPHAENFSGLLHIPSEVRGCRRVVVDVNRPQGRTPRIDTGVAVFLHKRPGPSIPSPNKSKQSLNPMNHSADGNAPCSTANHPPPPQPTNLHVIPRPREGSQAPIQNTWHSPPSSPTILQGGRVGPHPHPFRHSGPRSRNPSPPARRTKLPPDHLGVIQSN